MTGESLFITHFTNTGSSGRVRRAAFAAPYPGTILPIDLQVLQQQYPTQGDKQTALICQKDAFLCAALGTKIAIHFNKKIGAGFFGGEGFIMQKLGAKTTGLIAIGNMLFGSTLGALAASPTLLLISRLLVATDHRILSGPPPAPRKNRCRPRRSSSRGKSTSETP